MNETVTLEKVLILAEQLSLVDKVRLMELLAPRIQQEQRARRCAGRRPLRGAWRGLDITEKEITEARRQMWENFPRQDV